MKKILSLSFAVILSCSLFACSSSEDIIAPETSAPVTAETSSPEPAPAPEPTAEPTPKPTAEPPRETVDIEQIVGNHTKGIPGSNYLQVMTDMEAYGFYDFANPQNNTFDHIYQMSIFNYEHRVDLTCDVIYTDNNEVNTASFSVSSIGEDEEGFYAYTEQYWNYGVSVCYKGEGLESISAWISENIRSAGTGEEGSTLTVENIEFSINNLRRQDGFPIACFLQMEYIG